VFLDSVPHFGYDSVLPLCYYPNRTYLDVDALEVYGRWLYLGWNLARVQRREDTV